MVLVFWLTTATLHRAKIADLEHSYRLACETGDTSRAGQVETELRDIRTSRGGLVGEVAGKSTKNASLIGEADSGPGMTKHSISAADSDEALKENII
ncbi:hypothetical protein [Streptomyces sp. A5-4]|uniref:hypothetical protein n=1 Tax=Streptomyces sp. A5-4 TaxID=3384771 RepID=UPI003DA8F301